MALGKQEASQQDFWIATQDLPTSPGHPFYQKLNEVLRAASFDRFAEELCAPYYAERLGRPSIPPGQTPPYCLTISAQSMGRLPSSRTWTAAWRGVGFLARSWSVSRLAVAVEPLDDLPAALAPPRGAVCRGGIRMAERGFHVPQEPTQRGRAAQAEPCGVLFSHARMISKLCRSRSFWTFAMASEYSLPSTNALPWRASRKRSLDSSGMKSIKSSSRLMKNRLEPGFPWRPARVRNWSSIRRDS